MGQDDKTWLFSPLLRVFLIVSKILIAHVKYKSYLVAEFYYKEKYVNVTSSIGLSVPRSL